jgi:hypothetical protein
VNDPGAGKEWPLPDTVEEVFPEFEQVDRRHHITALDTLKLTPAMAACRTQGISTR